MSIKIRFALLWAFLSVATLAIAPGLHAARKPSRAVSLSGVVASVKSGDSSEEARRLCGITRLRGYVIDAQSKDIILLGIVDPNLAPLHLDDLVVAMRNVWGGYDYVRGRTRYYMDPGCSIDPNPAVIAQLRAFQTSHSTAESVESRAAEWERIGSQPQNVRVLGVPFDCRFAKVMVDADYYMKRLVNGSEQLGIDGFRSLSDLDVEASRQRLRTGKSTFAGGSVNRFWFSPGESTYEVQGGATILRSCDVQLLTEEEYLTEHGVLAGMNRPDPLASQFARSFSQKYDQIAVERPIYEELRDLFTFVAIARLMKGDGADTYANPSISYLLRSYRIAKVPVNRAVKGLTQVRPVNEVVETPNGKAQLSLVQSSCGGVSMSVRPRRIKSSTYPVVFGTFPVPPATSHTSSTARMKSGTASPDAAHASGNITRASAQPTIKRAVLNSRKSPKAMSWDVPLELE